ncbi:C40 family peptidase [Corynebacterium sp. CNCTC7651]|uniref:C40 family peptidase n=1 Tax=Corynebacterium sp. CNCTC7651 TaxID=2815361 RepID=UPI001F1861CA|nr:C40 family peptidase [Corynebacterium sp. CNCTC7651]
MGKHRKSSRTKQCIAAISAAGVWLTLLPQPALADDVDDMIAQMEQISHDAAAKVEELKGLEDEIAEAQKRVAELTAQADIARGDADRASGARAGFQHNVNGIAQSRYRNTYSELLLNTLDAGSPQAAIDRAAYLGALSRNAERTILGLNAASRDAVERSDAVARAVGEAEAKRAELDAKRAKLEREREELDEQVRLIEARVNALNPESFDRWVNKDNPVDVSGMILPAAGSGVVSAAMAQLGKPYGWGATGPNAFDCSGLMVWAYAQNGKGIPRTSQAQLAGGMPVPLSQLQPGDIIGYYPGTTHVGMYIGDGMIVHASDYGIPIQVVPYNSMPITGAVRY